METELLVDVKEDDLELVLALSFLSAFLTGLGERRERRGFDSYCSTSAMTSSSRAVCTRGIESQNFLSRLWCSQILRNTRDKFFMSFRRINVTGNAAEVNT